jgi:hypothetical protein
MLFQFGLVSAPKNENEIGVVSIAAESAGAEALALPDALLLGELDAALSLSLLLLEHALSSRTPDNVSKERDLVLFNFISDFPLKNIVQIYIVHKPQAWLYR